MNVQWTYIVRDVSITSTILIKRILCSMDVQCVYCVHCVHYTYYAHWMPPTKTQPSTNRCKAGVSIVDNKMDTMDIDFVHWTCPLVTNNEHIVSIVSIGDQWTFSTFWYVANGRINGRPLNVHWTWSLYTMWRMYTMGTPNRSCCTFTARFNKADKNLLIVFQKVGRVVELLWIQKQSICQNQQLKYEKISPKWYRMITKSLIPHILKVRFC